MVKDRKTGVQKLTKKPTSGLFLRVHAVTLAFAVTDYKLQGKSLDRLILSLAPRKFHPPFYMHSLYVLLSRVRTRSGLRILSKPADWDHLKKLRHEPELEIWERSYTGGRFNAVEAGRVALEVAERLQAEHKARQAQEAKEKAKEKAKVKANKQAVRQAEQARHKAGKAKGQAKGSGRLPTQVQGGAKAKQPQACGEAAASKQPHAPAAASKRPHTEAAGHEEGAQAKKKEKQQLRRLFSPGAHARARVEASNARKQKLSFAAEQSEAKRKQVTVRAAGAARRARQECDDVALQSVVWSLQSCATDSAAQAILLGVRAVSDLTGRPLCDGYFPSARQAPHPPAEGDTPKAAEVGEALRRWLETASRLASSTSVAERRAGLGILNMQRNQLREERRRSEVLMSRSWGTFEAPRAAPRCPNEAQVAAQLRRLASARSSCIENLKAMTAVVSAADTEKPHDWLGGRPPPERRCLSCGAAWTSSFGDQRIHSVTHEALQLAQGDPLVAFGIRDAAGAYTISNSDECPSDECPTDRSDVEGYSWFNEACMAPDAPPLLGLHWIVNPYAALRPGDAPNGAEDEVQPGEVVLNPDRLDASTLSTPFGEVTYRLIALVYYNGEHYITVGRSAVDRTAGPAAYVRVLHAQQWVCWDANRNGGIGCVLRTPPTANGPLHTEGGSVWNGYRAETAIYCRIMPEQAGEAVAHV